MSRYECCLCGFHLETSDSLEKHIDLIHWDIFKPKIIKEIPIRDAPTSNAEHSDDVAKNSRLETHDNSLLPGCATSNSDTSHLQFAANTLESGLGSVDLRRGLPSTSYGFQGGSREAPQASAGLQGLKSSLEIEGPENPENHKHVASIKSFFCYFCKFGGKNVEELDDHLNKTAHRCKEIKTRHAQTSPMKGKNGKKNWKQLEGVYVSLEEFSCEKCSLVCTSRPLFYCPTHKLQCQMTPTKKPHNWAHSNNHPKQDMSMAKIDLLTEKVSKVLNIDDSPSGYECPTKKVPNYFSSHAHTANISQFDNRTSAIFNNLKRNLMNFSEFSLNLKKTLRSRVNSLNPYVSISRDFNIDRKSLEIQTQKTPRDSLPKTRLERRKLFKQRVESEKTKSRNEARLDEQDNPKRIARSTGFKIDSQSPNNSRKRQSGKRNCPCCQFNRESSEKTKPASSIASPNIPPEKSLKILENTSESTDLPKINESSYCFLCSHQFGSAHNLRRHNKLIHSRNASNGSPEPTQSTSNPVPSTSSPNPVATGLSLNQDHTSLCIQPPKNKCASYGVNNAQFKCKICQAGFYSQILVNIHLKKNHKPEPDFATSKLLVSKSNPLVDANTTRPSTEPRKVKTEEKTAINKLITFCPKCEQNYSSHHSLLRHNKRKHSPSSDSETLPAKLTKTLIVKYFCKVCNHGFENSSLLSDHITKNHSLTSDIGSGSSQAQAPITSVKSQSQNTTSTIYNGHAQVPITTSSQVFKKYQDQVSKIGQNCQIQVPMSSIKAESPINCPAQISHSFQEKTFSCSQVCTRSQRRKVPHSSLAQPVHNTFPNLQTPNSFQSRVSNSSQDQVSRTSQRRKVPSSALAQPVPDTYHYKVPCSSQRRKVPIKTENNWCKKVLNESSYCTICDHQFPSVANLNRHNIRKHLDLEKIPCPDCGRTFKLEYDMKKHRRNIHLKSSKRH